jgi:hypothetical protein
VTYPSIGKGNGHDCCSLHDPGEWIPHEAQKLEEFALLRPSKSQLFKQLFITCVFSSKVGEKKHKAEW